MFPEIVDLRSRVEKMEKKIALEDINVAAGLGRRGVRRRSEIEFFGIPLWEIAAGPDLERGERRGHAKAIVAIGDIATGLFAIGGLAFGGVAIGGVAIGLLAAVGGGAIAFGCSIGGLAIGSVAIGGLAIGCVSIGGLTIGLNGINIPGVPR